MGCVQRGATVHEGQNRVSQQTHVFSNLHANLSNLHKNLLTRANLNFPRTDFPAPEIQVVSLCSNLLSANFRNLQCFQQIVENTARRRPT